MSTTRRRLAAALAIILSVGLLMLTLGAVKTPEPQSMTAGIVNLDEPVKIDGQLAPMGRQLAAELINQESSFNWEITTAEAAKAGLTDGTYAAVVTIPKDFSASATSFSSAKTVQQAVVDVKTPPGSTDAQLTAVELVTRAATNALGEQLSQTFISSMLGGFGTLQTELGEAADGAAKLAGGAKQSATGTKLLADGTGEFVDGLGMLADGAEAGATGAHALSDGLAQLNEGTSLLASQTGTLEQVFQEMIGGLRTFADLLAAQSTGMRTIADGASGLSELLAPLVAGAQTVADVAVAHEATAGALFADTQAYAEKIMGFCLANSEAAICTPEELEALTGLVTQAGTSAAESTGLKAGTQGTADGVKAVSDGVGGENGLVAGLGEAAKGAEALAAAGNEMATQAEEGSGQITQLTEAITGLDTGVSALSTGASQLAEGTTLLAGGLGTASTESGALVEGFQQLATGSQKLADGVGELSDGLGTAVDEIPSYTNSEVNALANGVSQPVAAPAVDSGTSTTGALAMVLLLWLASFILLMVYPPFTKHSVTSVQSAVKMTFTAWYRPTRWALIAGAVSGLVLGVWAAASFMNILTTIVVGALIAVVFVSVQQALVATAGIFGRIVSVAILLLAGFAGLGALSPLNALLPTGLAERILSFLTVSGAPSGTRAVVGLLAWGVGAFLVTIWATSRRRSKPGRALLLAEVN